MKLFGSFGFLVCIWVLLVPLARADGPVVCLSASGSTTNYDLQSCQVPPHARAFVELIGHNLLTSTGVISLSTLRQTCVAPVPATSSNVCAVQATDEVLEIFGSAGISYQIVVSWSTPVYTQTVIQGGESYTIAVDSPDYNLKAVNSATAGDGIIAVVLVILIAIGGVDMLLRGVLK